MRLANERRHITGKGRPVGIIKVRTTVLVVTDLGEPRQGIGVTLLYRPIQEVAQVSEQTLDRVGREGLPFGLLAQAFQHLRDECGVEFVERVRLEHRDQTLGEQDLVANRETLLVLVLSDVCLESVGDTLGVEFAATQYLDQRLVVEVFRYLVGSELVRGPAGFPDVPLRPWDLETDKPRRFFVFRSPIEIDRTVLERLAFENLGWCSTLRLRRGLSSVQKTTSQTTNPFMIRL